MDPVTIIIVAVALAAGVLLIGGLSYAIYRYTRPKTYDVVRGDGYIPDEDGHQDAPEKRLFSGLVNVIKTRLADRGINVESSTLYAIFSRFFTEGSIKKNGRVVNEIEVEDSIDGFSGTDTSSTPITIPIRGIFHKNQKIPSNTEDCTNCVNTDEKDNGMKVTVIGLTVALTSSSSEEA